MIRPPGLDPVTHRNSGAFGETEKPEDRCGRPQFYLSLVGYCFSRPCEGG